MDVEEARREKVATEYKANIMSALHQQSKDKAKEQAESERKRSALEKF